jgi:hypothetical protein
MRTLLLTTALLAPSFLSAQAVPADITRERADRAQWLAGDPLSPARAIAMTAFSPRGITLGPEGSDIPLAGTPQGTVTETAGRITLRGWDAERVLPRGRPTAVRGLRLVPIGAPGRSWLVAYQDAKPGKNPKFYPYAAAAAQTVTLTTAAPKPQRILAPDGTSIDATEIGTVPGTIGGTTVTLRVMRIPTGDDESQLILNFRDATNDAGTYPAGRFVELIPVAGGRYTLDFNRAFNPNCAYSSVFPCPIPWSGNVFTAKVEAGEMYPAEVVK